MSPPPGTFRDLVVIGASAGGVEALRELVKQLPVDLQAGVLVVLHVPAGGTSVLGSILDAAGPLPAEPAQHGAPIEHGHLYVGSPDHHLLVEGDCVVLSDAPTESGHRPAINALFRSAALARGPLVAGVVLSGVLDDGAAGLAMIKASGGLAIVQDPDDAAYRGMPDSALAGLDADHVLPARAIGEQLAEILAVPVELAQPAGPGAMQRYEQALARNGSEESMPEPSADAAGLLCPDCGRELSMRDRDAEAFRCQAGHAWSADALLATADHRMQAALWTALQALDEKTALTRQMEGTARDRGSDDRAGRYSASGQETDAAARLIRARLTSGLPGSDKDGDPA
ncbi:chemotaxis protein CheB [Kribbella sp. DT2]|uniref:chemotaxis protein CheB n=1 Tax=Kribbella sp. DT2 TaxID=3393427 RepID=UPI003CEC843D